MDTPLSEDLDHQVEAAVQHLGMLGELRCCVHEALKTDDATHAIETPELEPHCGEHVQPGRASEPEPSSAANSAPRRPWGACPASGSEPSRRSSMLIAFAPPAETVSSARHRPGLAVPARLRERWIEIARDRSPERSGWSAMRSPPLRTSEERGASSTRSAKYLRYWPLYLDLDASASVGPAGSRSALRASILHSWSSKSPFWTSVRVRRKPSSAPSSRLRGSSLVATDTEGMSSGDPDRYLLLVWWTSVESHTEGFRRSPDYQRWRELLHSFYDPFPTVEHYLSIPDLSTKRSPELT